MTTGLQPRGERIDIGGRALRVIRQGRRKPGAPLVLLEAGAFGFSADWAVVQDLLDHAGLRSLAYDRAGLGRSDPGPPPRNGEAVVRDLEALLSAAGEPAPYIVVGHSMAGLSVRLFTARHLGEVAGVVLVDATTPEASADPHSMRFVDAFGQLARGAAWAAGAGLLKPLSPLGDAIGVTPEAAAEKRWAFSHAPHNRWAADEASHWHASAAIARSQAPYPPDLPVAVVTAGGWEGAGDLKAAQSAPARASNHGYEAHVAGANHATLLGRRYAREIVKAVEHVMQVQGNR
jgi:pimeloyl-ACP methyl ester carboxylesterase